MREQRNNSNNYVYATIGEIPSVLRDLGFNKDVIKGICKGIQQESEKINEALRKANQSDIFSQYNHPFREPMRPHNPEARLNNEPSIFNKLQEAYEMSKVKKDDMFAVMDDTVPDKKVFELYVKKIQRQPNDAYYVGLSGEVVKLSLENNEIFATNIVTNQKQWIDVYTLKTLLPVSQNNYNTLKGLYPLLPIIKPDDIQKIIMPKVNKLTNDYISVHNYPVMCFVSNATDDKEQMIKQGNIQKVVCRSGDYYIGEDNKPYRYALVLDSSIILGN